MFGHTKREATSFCVAEIPGWARSFSEWKTCFLKEEGTNGRGEPVEVSQTSGRAIPGRWRDWREREVVSGRGMSSDSCATAMPSKSTWDREELALISIQERASAVWLSMP